MSGYKSNEFVKGVTSRTKTNLEFINQVVASPTKKHFKRRKRTHTRENGDTKAYEITQRFNFFWVHNIANQKTYIQINANNELEEVIVNLFVKIEEIDVSLKKKKIALLKKWKK